MGSFAVYTHVEALGICGDRERFVQGQAGRQIMEGMSKKLAMEA